LDNLIGRFERAGADQDRDFLAGIEHVGGAAQIVVVGHRLGLGEAHAGMQRAVFARRLLIRRFL